MGFFKVKMYVTVVTLSLASRKADGLTNGLCFNPFVIGTRFSNGGFNLVM